MVNLKEKQHHMCGPCLNFFLWLKIRKRDASIRRVVMSISVAVFMVLVI